MKVWISLLATLCLGLFVSSARAADGDTKPEGGDRPHHSLKDIIEKLDKNHDGKIDKDELAAASPKLQERLKKLDTNNDGVIDENEIKVALENAAKHTHKKDGGDNADPKTTDTK